MSARTLVAGNYVLGDTIGVGSFGKVKLATHRLTGNKLAIKILNKRKITLLDMVGQVKREIQNMKLFRHPHIIKMYEVISTSTDIFMVMEYVSGGELFDRIAKSNGLDEDHARRFFQQIISGVDYCHRYMVVHRDLKPENLLLDKNDNVKIADFGLSNMMTDGDFLKTSCGSPNYAAPEVISGELYAGPEVDVWSCAVILYTILCGKLPFFDDYIGNLFRKIKAGKFKRLSANSDAVNDLLDKMLAVDPVKRATMDEIINNKWVVKDLPDYLKPHNQLDREKDISKVVVKEVCSRLQVEEAELLRALVPNGKKYDVHLRAAYHLMFDHMKLDGKLEPDHPVSSGDAMFQTTARQPQFQDSSFDPPTSVTTFSGSFQSPDRGGHQREPSMTLPRSFSTLEHLDSEGRQRVGTHPPNKKKKRSKWNLGIRSRNDPHEIMSEVYRAMKALGVEWKIITPFNVMCRFAAKENGPPCYRMVLQLYTVSKLGDVYYVLDFKNVPVRENYGVEDGDEHLDDAFAFFDLAAKLLKELTT